MGKQDAEVTIGADADAVTRACAVGKMAFIEMGRAMSSSIGDASRAIVSDLSNVALAQGKVNFASQHQAVRDFEKSSARMAVAVGRDFDQVRQEAERTGNQLGKRPGEVVAWATEVGKLTGNFDGARQAMSGMDQLAALTGRRTEDYRGLAVELANVGGVAGDTSHAVGMIVAQSEKFKTVGGPAAFANQIEALSDTISQFSVKGEADFLKITAAAGALTKGMSQAQAQRVQQQAFGAIAGDPLGWSRVLGRDITNKQGQVEHPEKILQELTETFKKRYGKEAKTALQYNFGVEAGAAMFNADWKGAAEASGMAPSGKAAAAQKAYLGSDAGKRDVADAHLAESSRALMGSSTLLGNAADKLQQFAASNPLTSTFVATALGSGMSSFMSSFGTKLSTIMGGSGGGGALGGLKDLVGGGKMLGALGLAGAGVGFAAQRISATAGELYGNRDAMTSFADDLLFATGGKSAVAKGNNSDAAVKQRAQAQANLDLAHAKQRVETAQRAGLTGDPKDVQLIADAIARALKDIKVEVTDASETPIQATVKGGNSSSAGKQNNG